MALSKYYKYGTLYPAGLVTLFNLVYTIIYISYFAKYYKSEWLTGESVAMLSLLLVFINAIFFCALSAFLFLNKYQRIQSNFLLSLLTWLLPSFIYGITLLSSITFPLDFNEGFESSTLHILVNTIPYLAGQLIAFIHFRNNRKEGMQK